MHLFRSEPNLLVLMIKNVAYGSFSRWGPGEPHFGSKELFACKQIIACYPINGSPNGLVVRI